MKRKRIAPALVVVLLLSAASAAAGTGGGERARNWALGWEDGVTLRRALGPWDLGLSAGPDDWLWEQETYVWRADWPDSVQGTLDDEHKDHRESGYVRLGVARELTAWQTLSMQATLSGQYTWVNSEYKSVYYDWSSDNHETRTRDFHSDAYVVALGARIAWRPVPFISIQTRLGLAYRSLTGNRIAESYDDLAGLRERTESPEQEASFYDYGYGGTGSLEFFVWF